LRHIYKMNALQNDILAHSKYTLCFIKKRGSTMVDIMNIPRDCQFVFSVLDELYVSHHA